MKMLLLAATILARAGVSCADDHVFDLDESGWHATDVVVARQAEPLNHASLRVSRVVAGSLEPGTLLSLTELGRRALRDLEDLLRSRRGVPMLFLQQQPHSLVELARPDGSGAGSVMRSVLWQERGTFYTINRRDEALELLPFASVPDVLSRIQAYQDVRKLLDEHVSAQQVARLRDLRLVPAIRALSEVQGGEEVLRAFVEDDRLLGRISLFAVTPFVIAASNPEDVLVRQLQRESEFWNQMATRLSELQQIDESAVANHRLVEHFYYSVAVLDGLAASGLDERSRQAVRQFRSTCVGLPPLKRLVEICDEHLER